MFRGSMSWGRARTPKLVGLASVAAFAALVLPSAAFAQQGINVISSFQNAPGTLTDLYQPLFLYQEGPNTNYSQTAEFTNGTRDVAPSTILVSTEGTNSNGSTSALLIFKVTGAVKTYELSGVACVTQSGYSECFTGVTIPAGQNFDDLRLTRSFQDASTGNYWWNAALVTGSTQVNAGLIEVPGGTTTVDPNESIINQIQYIGTQTSCSSTPQSNIYWFEPFQSSTSSYGVYEGSLQQNGTCPTTIKPLNLGGETTGVNIIAPSS